MLVDFEYSFLLTLDFCLSSLLLRKDCFVSNGQRRQLTKMKILIFTTDLARIIARRAGELNNWLKMEWQ